MKRDLRKAEEKKKKLVRKGRQLDQSHFYKVETRGRTRIIVNLLSIYVLLKMCNDY